VEARDHCRWFFAPHRRFAGEGKEKIMRKTQGFAGLVVCVSLAWAASAPANVVADWSRVANAAVAAGRPAAHGVLDVALVQAAVHDAVQAIEGRFEPYFYADATRRGFGSPAAAVAAAAHGVLALLYPAQQPALDAHYTQYLMDHGLAGDPGLQVGEAAAKALFSAHYRPVLPMEPFFGGTGPGEWRPTAPGNPPMAFLYMAFTTPFTMNRPSQFRPPPAAPPEEHPLSS
jgi:hypothetical protein